MTSVNGSSRPVSWPLSGQSVPSTLPAPLSSAVSPVAVPEPGTKRRRTRASHPCPTPFESPSTGRASKTVVTSPVLPLAIVDPTPLYRRGLSDAFAEEGFLPEEPSDIEAWTALDSPRIVLVTVDVVEDVEILRRFTTSRTDLVVVALLREPTVEMYVAAIQAGASGAVAWMATPETVVRVVGAACTQQWMLPIAVARTMTDRIGMPPEAVGASPTEVKWLKLMANGTTISQLARDVGYSEREMFRLLRNLYIRMGVRNRTEALLKAMEWRLLQ